MSSFEEELDAFAEKYAMIYCKPYVKEGWALNKNQWLGSPVVGRGDYQNFWNNINQMIENAPLATSLTSPYSYVREYKQWYEKRKGKNNVI